MTLNPADFFHTGVVVDDLERAMRRMHAVAGYRFTKPADYPMRVRTEQGDIDVTFRFVYSLQSPHIELVASIPGTVWTPAPNNAAHHLGYFVDDLAAGAKELEEAGFGREACGLDGDDPAVFVYYRDSAGIRIELVDRSVMGPDFQAYLRANSDPGEW